MVIHDPDTFIHVTKTRVQVVEITENYIKSLVKAIEEGYETDEDIVALRKMAAAKYILAFHKIITADFTTAMLIVLDDISDVIDGYSRVTTYFANNNRELRLLLREVEERMQIALNFLVDLISAYTADRNTNCKNDEFSIRVKALADSRTPNTDINVDLVDYYKQVVAFYRYYVHFCRMAIKKNNVSYMAQIALMTSACLIIHCKTMADIHLVFDYHEYDEECPFS